MTVKELIKKLEQYPEDAQVMVYNTLLQEPETIGETYLWKEQLIISPEESL